MYDYIQYPHEDTVCDCRDPGHLRARFWFGAEEHLKVCFKPDDGSKEAYVFLTEMVYLPYLERFFINMRGKTKAVQSGEFIVLN